MRPRRGRIGIAAKTFSINIKSLRDYSRIRISIFSKYFLFLKKECGKKGEIGKLLPHYYEEMGRGKEPNQKRNMGNL